MTGDPVRAAVDHLTGVLDRRPTVAVVLGSGLGGLADGVDDATAVPYAEIPGFAPPTVAGHRGRLVAGRLEGRDVVVFQGRYHAYEGHDPRDLVVPVRAAIGLGARSLVVTCAAGGINPRFGPGTIMVLSDHLNLMGRNPLVGPVHGEDDRFPDMSAPYDLRLRTLASEAAHDTGTEVVEGVYAAVLGPSYETPAEISMLSRLGADAVGMSTVPEVIAARAAGVPVLGLALITNAAAGLAAAPLDHQEVLAEGRASAERVERLIRGILRRI